MKPQELPIFNYVEQTPKTLKFNFIRSKKKISENSTQSTGQQAQIALIYKKLFPQEENYFPSKDTKAFSSF